MKRLVFSDLAEADLEDIGDYIAQDNPARAVSFLRELREACRGLCDTPLRYPRLDGHEVQALRRRPYGNYSIIYQANEDAVLIVRIFGAAMDLATALGD
jgi:toxin ParE1/3/4